MSDLDDIYWALQNAKSENIALASWQRSAGGSDSCRSGADCIERGIAAFERIRAKLRNGQMHVEPPDNYKQNSCYCSAPTCSPPCSWCTDPENSPVRDEAEGAK